MSLILPNNGTNPTFFSDFFNDNHWEHYDKLSAKSKLPAVNIEQHENSYHVSLVAPGMSKEDFSISLEKNVLSIEGSSQGENVNSDASKKYIRREFSYTSFKRSFQLPENIEEKSVKASYKDGILKIEIPMNAEKPKQKATNIEIQ